MSANRYTEVSNQSWFGRLGSAFTGILFGLLLIVISFALLFWNEGRSVKRYKTLKEGAGLVMTVATDVVDPINEGKLVHISGMAVTTDQPTDPMFGIAVNGIKLIRSTEMYQWQEKSESEERKKLGGGTETVTTYSYNKTWQGHRVDSSSFRHPEEHQNPSTMLINSDSFHAWPVNIGAFELSNSIINSINASEPITLDPTAVKTPAIWTGPLKVIGSNEVYLGANPQQPQIGDIRVKFSLVPQQNVSIVAKQTMQSFTPYVTEIGGKIELVESGIMDAASMFESAQASNRMLTWLIRLGGFVLMLVGFMLLFKPLSVMADVVPLFGNIVGIGTGFVAFILAATFSLVTIAIAWIVFRPILGISLLAVAVAFLFLLIKRAKAQSS